MVVLSSVGGPHSLQYLLAFLMTECILTHLVNVYIYMYNQLVIHERVVIETPDDNLSICHTQQAANTPAWLINIYTNLQLITLV
jgi:hypothetical protein